MKSKFEITYKIGNRKVSRTEWERHLTKSVKEKSLDAVEKRIASAVCPVHGQRATASRTGSKFDIQACCEQGLQAAKQAIGLSEG